LRHEFLADLFESLGQLLDLCRIGLACRSSLDQVGKGAVHFGFEPSKGREVCLVGRWIRVGCRLLGVLGNRCRDEETGNRSRYQHGNRSSHDRSSFPYAKNLPMSCNFFTPFWGWASPFCSGRTDGLLEF
jgi:hypothetical protein